jgi:hypothetical protein
MSKLKVMNGTPVGNEHLCRSCSNGQYTVGYRESDVLVICTNSNPARTIPFVVHECTQFWDRNRPDYDEMTKLALSFSEGRRKRTPGFRQSGFERVPVVVEDEPEDEDRAEAARIL